MSPPGQPKAEIRRAAAAAVAINPLALAYGSAAAAPQTGGLAVVDLRPDAYERASAGLFALFADLADPVEPGSMEEAFLDISGATRRLGSPATIAARIDPAG